LNATWTCTASAGSTCSPTGSGNINDVVNILAGGNATYTLQADVTASLGVNDVINTATVTAPAGFNDNNTNNDSSTDDDVPLDDEIFSDGFEDPPV